MCGKRGKTESSVERQTRDEGEEAVIIGGMVLDIHGTPSGPANPRTTTPGKVDYVLGGVARNVAECMSKLGTRPFMISAVGVDMAGNLLLEHWKSAKLSTRGIRRQKDISTAVACNIIDINGEVAAGVASVESIERFLTPEWILQFKYNISSAPVLMVDANLDPLALVASCRLAAESNVPVWFEPVSFAKSRRIAPIREYVTFASPNEDELIAMANALSSREVFHRIKNEAAGNKYSVDYLFQMLKPAICVLLEKGIKVVIVTLGPDGVFFCTKGESSFLKAGLGKTKHHIHGSQLHKLVASTCPLKCFPGSSHFFAVHLPSLPASVVRLTGAGDCLVGGMLASLCNGLDALQSLAVGVAAAKAAVEAETNVPSVFDLASIADDARSIYSAAKIVSCQSML